MIREIITDSDPILRLIAREVSLEELQTAPMQKLVDDLVQTLQASKIGAGLAAPQIAESLRICIVDKPLTVLINPVLTPVGSKQDVSMEGCLSVPGMRGPVLRPQTVRVQALDRNGKPIDAVWTKFRAIVVQHEVDHLDGVLYTDRAQYIEPDEATMRTSAPPTERALSATTNGTKKTFVVDSEKPVGGKQYVAFTFEHPGAIVDLRIQPGGATVTGAWLSNMRLKRKDYPAGKAKEALVGAGLSVARGDELRVELKMPKGKRRIIAEADFDGAR